MNQTLIEKYGRAQLGIDGNCGFALLGPDLQEGESEFVEIGGHPSDDQVNLQLIACKRALKKLRERLNLPDLNYYFGASHPYGG